MLLNIASNGITIIEKNVGIHYYRHNVLNINKLYYPFIKYSNVYLVNDQFYNKIKVHSYKFQLFL